MRIILIDVSVSLAIAAIGSLLVVLSLGTVERWRTTILGWSRSRHSPPRIAADDAAYAVEVNVRMIAEGASSVLPQGHSIPPIYGPSGLVRARVNHKKRFGGGPKRIEVRSMRRFGTEPGSEKGGMRGRHFRKPLHEYADKV
jgi:hypothetical protein